MFGTMQDVPLVLGRMVRHSETRHAHSTITSFDDAGRPRVQSMGEVGQRCSALAHLLTSLGVRHGDSVATLAGNTSEHLEAQFAVPAMGAVLHPVNVRLRPDQLVDTVRRAGDSVLLVDPRWAGLAAELARTLDHVEHLVVLGVTAPELDVPARVRVHALESALDGMPTSFDWPDMDERTAAVALFTSGTTGTPKAVVYSHRSVWLHSMQLCMAESADLSEEDTALSGIPLSHVMGWGLPYATLLSGASVVLARAREGRAQPSGADLAQIVADFRPNKAVLTPSMCLALSQHLEKHPQVLRPLEEIIIGGSPMPSALYETFVDRHDVRLLQAWGMTESGPLGTIARPSPHASASLRRRQALSQGRFPACVDARIVDDAGVVSPDGESVGEVQIRGPWVTASYLGDPDDRGDHFDEGWLRTGDLGTMSAEGFLTITDRLEDAIASGGEWISSVELENAVMMDGRVAEAACVGVPDERWGHRPLVLVVPKEGAQVEARSLWGTLDSRLEVWKRPDHWAFVDDIPRTSVGKFDKKEIRFRLERGEYEVVTVRAPGSAAG